MKPSTLLSTTALKGFGTYKRDSRGNIAMLTGVCIIPLVIIIGFAVDYRRAANNKYAAQSAIDSAVLVGGKTYAAHPSPSNVQKMNAAKLAANIVFDADMRKYGA